LKNPMCNCENHQELLASNDKLLLEDPMPEHIVSRVTVRLESREVLGTPP
ncbi:uncharacterized protein METZ01_LOCUS426859, partial [marine metagenome]